jgi:hypothetical protein
MSSTTTYFHDFLEMINKLNELNAAVSIGEYNESFRIW